MRYLSTSDDTVAQLKKHAKKLQRAGGGKHSELLNQVAKQAGYDHWHHVIKCNEVDQAGEQMRAIRRDCEAVIKAELRGDVKLAVTSDGPACPPFVLFSTGVGDAWLLEPNELLAMCLVWQGKRQAIGLRDDPVRMAVEWDVAYELLGDLFRVESRHPTIGTRAIGGYPLEDIRKLIDQVQSPMMKMATVIGQFDAVEITTEVVSQLVKNGRSADEVLALKAQGFLYSPSRDSFLSPLMSSDDIDDDGDD